MSINQNCRSSLQVYFKVPNCELKKNKKMVLMMMFGNDFLKSQVLSR